MLSATMFKNVSAAYPRSLMRRRVPNKPRPPIESIDLGKLALGEELGRGGFGIVYKATIEGIDIPFAVKLLDPSPFNDRERAGERSSPKRTSCSACDTPVSFQSMGSGSTNKRRPTF